MRGKLKIDRISYLEDIQQFHQRSYRENFSMMMAALVVYDTTPDKFIQWSVLYRHSVTQAIVSVWMDSVQARWRYRSHL